MRVYLLKHQLINLAALILLQRRQAIISCRLGIEHMGYRQLLHIVQIIMARISTLKN